MYVPLFFFGKEREEIIDMSDMSHVYSVILSQDSISIHHLKVDLRLSTNLVTKILRHFGKRGQCVLHFNSEVEMYFCLAN